MTQANDTTRVFIPLTQRRRNGRARIMPPELGAHFQSRLEIRQTAPINRLCSLLKVLCPCDAGKGLFCNKMDGVCTPHADPTGNDGD